MPLSETKELQSTMAFLDCIDSFEPKLGILGIVRQPKRPPIIVDDKLAILVSQASEQTPYYAGDSGRAQLAFLLPESQDRYWVSQGLAYRFQQKKGSDKNHV